MLATFDCSAKLTSMTPAPLSVRYPLPNPSYCGCRLCTGNSNTNSLPTPTSYCSSLLDFSRTRIGPISSVVPHCLCSSVSTIRGFASRSQVSSMRMKDRCASMAAFLNLCVFLTSQSMFDRLSDFLSVAGSPEYLLCTNEGHNAVFELGILNTGFQLVFTLCFELLFGSLGAIVGILRLLGR